MNVWGVAEIAVRAGSGTPGPLVALSIALNPLTKIVTTDLCRDVRQDLSMNTKTDLLLAAMGWLVVFGLIAALIGEAVSMR